MRREIIIPNYTSTRNEMDLEAFFVRTIQLPCGERTSQLAMGSAGIGISSGMQRPLALLEAAFEAGIRHFDTAPSYGMGMAERCLGEFLVRHRYEVTITDKYGLRPPRVGALKRLAIKMAKPVIRKAAPFRRLLRRPASSLPGDDPGPALSADAARASLEHTLRELRTDRIDIWLLHEATAAGLHEERLLRFLEDVVREGKVGAFGVGGAAYKMPEIYATRRDYCQVIQCEWDALEPDMSYPGTFRSRFGVFQYWPARITEHLSQNSAAARSWSDEVGVDLTAPDTLNALVLRAALISNPDGLIVFQSRSKENIEKNARIASDATLDPLAVRLVGILRREGPALRHP